MKIGEETLKKHGLKAVKFSELSDGDEFNIDIDFDSCNDPDFYRRKIQGPNIGFADGTFMTCLETVAEYLEDDVIAYVRA